MFSKDDINIARKEEKLIFSTEKRNVKPDEFFSSAILAQEELEYNDEQYRVFQCIYNFNGVDGQLYRSLDKMLFEYENKLETQKRLSQDLTF